MKFECLHLHRPMLKIRVRHNMTYDLETNSSLKINTVKRRYTLHYNNPDHLNYSHPRLVLSLL